MEHPLELIKKNQKITSCNLLVLETLGSRPVTAKNLQRAVNTQGGGVKETWKQGTLG